MSGWNWLLNFLILFSNIFESILTLFRSLEWLSVPLDFKSLKQKYCKDFRAKTKTGSFNAWNRSYVSIGPRNEGSQHKNQIHTLSLGLYLLPDQTSVAACQYWKIGQILWGFSPKSTVIPEMPEPWSQPVDWSAASQDIACSLFYGNVYIAFRTQAIGLVSSERGVSHLMFLRRCHLDGFWAES